MLFLIFELAFSAIYVSKKESPIYSVPVMKSAPKRLPRAPPATPKRTGRRNDQDENLFGFFPLLGGYKPPPRIQTTMYEEESNKVPRFYQIIARTLPRSIYAKRRANNYEPEEYAEYEDESNFNWKPIISKIYTGTVMSLPRSFYAAKRRANNYEPEEYAEYEDESNFFNIPMGAAVLMGMPRSLFARRMKNYYEPEEYIEYVEEPEEQEENLFGFLPFVRRHYSPRRTAYANEEPEENLFGFLPFVRRYYSPRRAAYANEEQEENLFGFLPFVRRYYSPRRTAYANEEPEENIVTVKTTVK